MAAPEVGGSASNPNSTQVESLGSSRLHSPECSATAYGDCLPRGALAVGAAFLIACSDDSGARAVPTESSVRELPGRQVAACGEGGDASRKWRRDATTEGPIGFFGPARDFHQRSWKQRPDGSWGAKLPVIVDGHRDVTLSVAPVSAGQVGIDFGDFRTAKSVKTQARDRRFGSSRAQVGRGQVGQAG